MSCGGCSHHKELPKRITYSFTYYILLTHSLIHSLSYVYIQISRTKSYVHKKGFQSSKFARVIQTSRDTTHKYIHRRILLKKEPKRMKEKERIQKTRGNRLFRKHGSNTSYHH